MLKAIAKIFSTSFLGKIVLGALGMLLIRYMSPNEFAAFSFGVGVATAISQLIASSINRIYIVGHESLNERRAFSTPLGLQNLLILLAVFVLLVLFGWQRTLILPIVLMVIGNCSFRYVQTFYQEQNKFNRFASSEILRTLLVAVGLLPLIYFRGNELRAWEVISVQGGARLLVFFFFMVKSRRLSSLLRFGGVPGLVAETFRNEYKFLFGYFFFLALFAQTDVFCLRYFSDDLQLATYGAGYRYYSLLILGLGSVKVVLFPAIKTAKSKNDIKNIYSEYAKIVKVVVPLILVGAYLAGWIMPLIDEGKYPASIWVFRILSFSAVVSLFLSPHAELLHANKKFAFLFKLMFVSLVLNVGLNSLLVMKWDAIGAAIATTASFAFVNGIIFWKSLSVVDDFKEVAAPQLERE